MLMRLPLSLFSFERAGVLLVRMSCSPLRIDLASYVHYTCLEDSRT